MGLLRRKSPEDAEDVVEREALERLAAIDDEHLAAVVVLRLVPLADLPADLFLSARPLLEGWAAVPAADLPDRVVVPPDQVWERRGGLDRWRAVADRNVAGLLDHPEALVRHADVDGQVVTAFMTPSASTSALVTRFPDLLARTGETDRGAGALVVVPHPQQVCWHVVAGGEPPALVEALVGLAEPRADGPAVHWVHEGRWTTVAAVERGRVRVALPPALVAATGMSGAG